MGILGNSILLAALWPLVFLYWLMLKSMLLVSKGLSLALYNTFNWWSSENKFLTIIKTYRRVKYYILDVVSPEYNFKTLSNFGPYRNVSAVEQTKCNTCGRRTVHCEKNCENWINEMIEKTIEYENQLNKATRERKYIVEHDFPGHTRVKEVK